MKHRHPSPLPKWLVMALVAALHPPALAQPVPAADPFARMRLDSGDPADRLAGYLRTLAVSPRDLEALTGAGRAALDVGDANAAIGFYARADGIAPRNGRIKAGLGTALLQMGKGRDAARLFDQATDLGVPETDVAADRGLAYDLRGDPRRAQKDYALALRTGEDAETTRRMALSLGISGDRDAAIQLLTPLLYKNDAAAWRARAFILAMNGDVEGAVAIAAGVMPGPQAQAMRPFLARLATLKSAEKAKAVHFGEMPSDGSAPPATSFAGAPAAAGSYRPETVDSFLATTPAPTGRPTARWLRNRAALLKAYTPKAAAAELKAEAAAPPSTPATRDAVGAKLASRTAAEVKAAGRIVPDGDEAPVLALKLDRTGRRKAVVDAPPADAPPIGKAAGRRPQAAEKKADAATRKKADAPAAAKQAKAAAKEAGADPARVWVQVAGGANKGDLPEAWARVKGKAPDLLKGRTPSTSRLRATNRLLVGPFKSAGEAQALVNKLVRSGMSGFIVETGKGQAVEKLPAG